MSGDRLYIVANKDYKSPHEFLEWKPGGEPRPLYMPVEFSDYNGSGFFDGCVDGKLLFNLNDCWLADPSGKKRPFKLPCRLNFCDSPPIKGWRLVNSKNAGGTQNSQVALLSEDFKRIVPLTNSRESYSALFLQANGVWKPEP